MVRERGMDRRRCLLGRLRVLGPSGGRSARVEELRIRQCDTAYLPAGKSPSPRGSSWLSRVLFSALEVVALSRSNDSCSPRRSFDSDGDPPEARPARPFIKLYLPLRTDSLHNGAAGAPETRNTACKPRYRRTLSPLSTLCALDTTSI